MYLQMQYDDNSHTESDDEYMHTIYHSESHYWQMSENKRQNINCQNWVYQRN